MGPCSKRCTITKETRNNCARCRFERCIVVGMAVEKIRFGKTPKHVANLIMNATSRTINPNFFLNSPATSSLDIKSRCKNSTENYNNLIKSLISYIDSATHEYLSMLQHQKQLQHNNNYHQQSYGSLNSNQNIINFTNKTQFNDYHANQSSVYLTPSTSSSSLPQSKSTSPYLHQNLQQQPQQHIQQLPNTNFTQELLFKLKQKIINKLNEYLGDLKMNDYELSEFNKVEKENTKSFNTSRFNYSKENIQLSSSFECTFVAYLFLVISDQVKQSTSKSEIDTEKNSISNAFLFETLSFLFCLYDSNTPSASHRICPS